MKEQLAATNPSLLPPTMYLGATQYGRKSMREAYETVFDAVIGNGHYVFASINLPIRHLRKSIGTGEFYPLGHALSEQLRSTKAIDAYQTFWTKFFLRLNPHILKSRAKHFGERLRFIGCFENSGRQFDPGSRSIHSHLLIAIPKDRSFSNVTDAFQKVWVRYVCPLRSRQKILDFQHRTAEDRDTITYSMKQWLSYEVASDRLILPTGFNVPRTQTLEP